MNKLQKMGWNIICVLAIVVFLSMIISKAVTGWSSVFSYRVFYIMSESMEPEIHENGFVIGRTISSDDELFIGRIYAYRTKGLMGEKLIIHRLIDFTEDGKCIFKGDYNEEPDEKAVERSDIGYEIVVY